ncbi:MAG: VOC family protein [Acidimicrobiia bacterium]
MGTPMQIVIACQEPGRLAAFWRTALGYAEEPPPDGFASWDEFVAEHDLPPDIGNDLDSAVDPAGVGPRLFFERVPESEPQRRIHLDINVVGRSDVPWDERKERVGAEAARLESAGATRLKKVERQGTYWIEMADPEGNWFCVQ